MTIDWYNTLMLALLYWYCANFMFTVTKYYESLEFRRVIYDNSYRRSKWLATALFIVWPFLLPLVYITLVLVAIHTNREV